MFVEEPVNCQNHDIMAEIARGTYLPIATGERVFTKWGLREFWETQKSEATIAERALTTWYKLAKTAAWANFGALKQTFGSADQVGTCVVFDVGNNRFRLIGRVNYAKGILYVLQVMDHAEYDRNRWVDSCGCHKPPPERPVTSNGSPTGRKPASRRQKRKR